MRSSDFVTTRMITDLTGFHSVLLPLQTVLSPAAHARTLLRGFLRMSREGNGVRNFPDFFMFWAHNSMRLCLLEYCLRIFVVSCSSLSEVLRQCRFRYVPLYITDKVVFGCFFYKNFTLLHSKISHM